MNDNSQKFRAEVTGIKEMKWSGNSIMYDTIESAQSYLDGLKNRWFGYDMSRIVPADTPKGESVDFASQSLYQNFRN